MSALDYIQVRACNLKKQDRLMIWKAQTNRVNYVPITGVRFSEDGGDVLAEFGGILSGFGQQYSRDQLVRVLRKAKKAK